MTGDRQQSLSLRRILWRLLKRFSPELWRQRRLLALSYLLILLSVGALLLAPWPLQMIIDYVITGRPLPELLAPLAAFSADGQVLLLALAAVAVAVSRALLSALQKITDARVRERVVVTLRDRLLAHLQSLPLGLHLQHRSGELVMRLVEDVHVFVRLLTKAVPTLLDHALTVVSTLAVMFWLEPRLALIGVVVLLAITALARCYAGPLHAASRDKRQYSGEVAGLAQEIIRGLPTVQALGLEQRTRRRFRDFNVQALRAGVQEVRVAVGMERAMAIAKAVALALISGGGALLVLREALTIGELTVFIAYMTQLLRPVEKINEMAATMIRGVTRGERLLQLLDHYPAVIDRPQAIELQRAEGLIELRSVAFSYPRAPDRDDGVYANGDGDEPLFSQVNVCLEAGSFCALVGPSGGGKSTLLGLLLRLYEPSEGEIVLDGVPLSMISLRSLRRQFAVMVQQTHLFAGTLREALAVDRELADTELWQALRQVALADAVRALPSGLDAPLGEDGANFSGGQRARLGLARALLLDRPILLLDEPTANVDATSRQVILDALEHHRRGRTCIVVTHQQDVAARADRVLHLKNGRLIVTAPGGQQQGRA